MAYANSTESASFASTILSYINDLIAVSPLVAADGAPDGRVSRAIADALALYFGLAGGTATAPAATPKWFKLTTTYAQLSAAGFTNDIELYSLPAGGVIHGVKTKHSAAFTGGALATYTVSVGIAGDLDKYAPAFDVFQAPSGTVFQLSGIFGSEDHGVATSIRVAAVSTGAHLNVATAGSVDIWLLVSVAV